MSAPAYTIAGLAVAYAQGARPRDVIARLRAARTADDPAWILRCDDTFVEAQLARLERAAPDELPLFGVPFAVKDNIDVAGRPTTAACPAFAYTPRRIGAAVVQRLVDAGAIAGRQDQPRSVRHRPRRHALALRRAAQRLRSALHLRRLELRLGGRGGARAWCLRPRHRHRRLRPRAGRLQQHRRPQADAGPAQHARRRARLPLARLRLGLRAAPSPTPRACSRSSTATTPSDAYSPPRAAAARRGWPAPLRFGVPRRRSSSSSATPTPQLLRRARVERCSGSAARCVEIDFAPFLEAARAALRRAVGRRALAAVARSSTREPDALTRHARDHRRRRAAARAVDAFDGAATASRHCARRATPLWRTSTCCWCRPPARSNASTRSRPSRSCSTATLGHYTNFVNLLDLCARRGARRFRADGLPFGVTCSRPAASDARAAALAGASTPRSAGRSARPAPRAPPEPAAGAVPTLPLAVVGAHLVGRAAQPPAHRARRDACVRTTRDRAALPTLRAARHHAAQARPGARRRRRRARSRSRSGRCRARRCGAFFAAVPPRSASARSCSPTASRSRASSASPRRCTAPRHHPLRRLARLPGGEIDP